MRTAPAAISGICHNILKASFPPAAVRPKALTAPRPRPSPRTPATNACNATIPSSRQVEAPIALNAPKYRALVTRIDVREGTKRRVAKHRQLRRSSNTDAGGCNAPVTPCNDLVTPSEAEAEAEALPPKEPTPAFSTPGRGKIREGSNADRLPTSPQAVRFAKLMHRKLTTPWQDNEIAAYKKIGRVPEDDLTALERYYGTHWPPKTGVNILRHDLLTLLNNLSGEIGRAHADETPAKAPAVKKPMRPML